ncbi:toll/interleukin-1 receptor domain-containing protein [Nocardia beijingensis]
MLGERLRSDSATPSTSLAPVGASALAPAPSNRKLFISHSSRIRDADELRPGDSINRHVHRKRFLAHLLGDLKARLTDLGYDVWVDRDEIQPGMEFEPMTHLALQNCGTAIVLIDLDSLDSSYLRKEATILMWRRWTCGINVVPVLLGSVSERDLAANPLGNPIGLSTLSVLRSPTRKTNKTAAQTVSEYITEHLLAAAPTYERSSPLERWVEDFSDLISAVNDERLWRVADRLGFASDDWNRIADRHAAVASAFLGTDVAHAYQALVQLAPLIDDERRRSKIVQRACPLWVDLDAARVIADASMLPPDQRVLAITTSQLRLGEHIVLRATCEAPEFAVIPFSDVVGESAFSEILQRYDTGLRRLLHLSIHDTPEDIAQEMESLGGGVYVLLRFENLNPGAVNTLIGTLRKRFPGVVFVILASKSSAIWKDNSFQRAYTRIDEPRERDARRYLSRTAALIGKELDVDGVD